MCALVVFLDSWLLLLPVSNVSNKRLTSKKKVEKEEGEREKIFA